MLILGTSGFLAEKLGEVRGRRECKFNTGVADSLFIQFESYDA